MPLEWCVNLTAELLDKKHDKGWDDFVRYVEESAQDQGQNQTIDENKCQEKADIKMKLQLTGGTSYLPSSCYLWVGHKTEVRAYAGGLH